MVVSAFFRFLLLFSGKRVRKDVEWLKKELVAVIVTGTPGVRGENTLGPYPRVDVTNQVTETEQVTELRLTGFAANRTTRLVWMIFVGWLRRQSTVGGFNKLVDTTIMAEVVDLTVDADTVKMQTRGPLATWSGLMLMLNPYSDEPF